MLPFDDRREAGRRLASKLAYYAPRQPVVLALPRGGVPVGFEVAKELDAPLDVYVVRKLGVPGDEELAMGAIASGGTLVLNDDIVRALNIPQDAIRGVAELESAEIVRREKAYRGERSPLPVSGRTVVLVDDGLATGATMRAAVQAIRELEPQSIVVAVPIAARETCEDIRAVADDVVCAETPASFDSVGRWYQDFAQMSDDDVRDLLSEARARRSSAPAAS